MSTRRLFIHSALLMLLVTGMALAGQYERTKDGRTLVWIEDHKPGTAVSWSGKRDADRYATGYGTLTWYTSEDVLETGSLLPRKHYRVSSRVSGTMVHGKFEEKPAPVPVKQRKKARTGISPQPSGTPSPSAETTPEKPSPAPTTPATTPTPTATPTPSAASGSLDSLMHAPSSLKVGSPAASPSPAIPAPSGTPDVSLQLAPPASSSPSPN